MSLKESLDRIFDVSSYGYVVNKWFLRTAFIIMLLLFAVVVRVDGWDVAVHGSSAFICPESQFSCVNPYVPLDCVDGYFDCDYQYIYGGEVYGVIPSGLARLFPYLCVGLFAFALLLNHLIYNKNFKVKKNEKN